MPRRLTSAAGRGSTGGGPAAGGPAPDLATAPHSGPAPDDRRPADPRPPVGGPAARGGGAPIVGAGRERSVRIAALGGTTVAIPIDRVLDEAAMRWSWVVRNRDRWSGQADTQRQQRGEARRLLKSLGIADGRLDDLGAAEVVQVSVPWLGEAEGWSGRIFPWEYVLAAATTYPGARRHPWVIRRLEADEGPAGDLGGPRGPVASGAIVTSAPGRIRDLFSFNSEQLLVRSALGVVSLTEVADPTPGQLRARFAELRPDLVHLAGVDNHQGAALLGIADSDHDGYLLVGDTGTPTQVGAEDLAALVGAGGATRLVACNFWNSGQRTAPLIVAAGAEAALGFQDQFDDGVAELFFSTFYRMWAAHRWGTELAFRGTMAALQAAGAPLHGTGIVLWTRRDALAEIAAAREADTVDGAAGSAPPVVGAPSPRETPAEVAATATVTVAGAPAAAAARAGADALWVDVKPLASVNYSLLHNNRPLFDQFRLRKGTTDTIRGVEIEVVLYLGGDSYPYRATIDVAADVVDMRDRIRVPLTSRVLSAFRESVQSVIWVCVRVGNTTVYEDTWAVLLEPIEEWTTDAGGLWLPSFVLPRDPAVAQVINAAAPLARVLRDDGQAAFDGYQSVKPESIEPYAVVEAQVKAIWSAIAYTLELDYLNPPPTYSRRAQRLRTPSEVLRTRSGTCIDLALFLAACLEYVDIYPVIFLLPGHALPGFWLSDVRHEEFIQVGGLGETDGDAGPPVDSGLVRQGIASAATVADAPWVLATADRQGPVAAEVRSRLRRPDLVALETVGVTDAWPYGRAASQASETLRGVVDAMVDIRTARLKGVSPLPLWNE